VFSIQVGAVSCTAPRLAAHLEGCARQTAVGRPWQRQPQNTVRHAHKPLRRGHVGTAHCAALRHAVQCVHACTAVCRDSIVPRISGTGCHGHAWPAHLRFNICRRPHRTSLQHAMYAACSLRKSQSWACVVSAAWALPSSSSGGVCTLAAGGWCTQRLGAGTCLASSATFFCT